MMIFMIPNSSALTVASYYIQMTRRARASGGGGKIVQQNSCIYERSAPAFERFCSFDSAQIASLKKSEKFPRFFTSTHVCGSRELINYESTSRRGFPQTEFPSSLCAPLGIRTTTRADTITKPRAMFARKFVVATARERRRVGKSMRPSTRLVPEGKLTLRRSNSKIHHIMAISGS
jgi:hypothetical protein